METDKKYCSNCGQKLKNDERFCSSCGINLTQDRENTKVNDSSSDSNENQSTEEFEATKFDDSNVENDQNKAIHDESEENFDWSNFNIWAFLLGFFYYIYKGLWQKGLLIASAALMINLILNLTLPNSNAILTIVGLAVAFVFGYMAPRDLERKEKYNETMWKELPDEFNNNIGIIGIFIVSLIIFIIGFSVQPTNSEVEDLATETTTSILADNGVPLIAENVIISEEVNENKTFYDAYAELSNGQTIRITVEYIPRADDQYDYYVYVEIPYEELFQLQY